MPYDENGTPVDIVLKPAVGVLPSHANIGQILETHRYLCMAAKGGGKINAMLKRKRKSPNCAEFIQRVPTMSGRRRSSKVYLSTFGDDEVLRQQKTCVRYADCHTSVRRCEKKRKSRAAEAGRPADTGQITLFDGRTGVNSSETSGNRRLHMYMLKLANHG